MRKAATTRYPFVDSRIDAAIICKLVNNTCIGDNNTLE